jgi:hypothetical protein
VRDDESEISNEMNGHGIRQTKPVRQSLLTRNHSDLYALWDEWQHGIGTNKPARSFTSRERGACKSLYSFRKSFWTLVDELVRRGNTSRVAIDHIYTVYGRSKSVTEVLRLIKKDRNRALA